MSRPELEIISQFTEDAVASQDMICQHPSCGKFIPKGDLCYYITTINPAKPGHLVCKSCLDWYSRKLSTTVRTRAPVEQSVAVNPPHVVTLPTPPPRSLQSAIQSIIQ
ncbi:hypothetical protein EDD16DRAFT_1522532 [Pisolithus croceorrhizus]|nr:hypothetical protein EV401DRAFT_1896367 [Pisolithus croceorrhizus]KAI6109300.1 hypothetical protein EDD16DRAFT_1522532 [Pisolithus croceorrhizus]KAI6167775.1 hypothetical protein EDD17DRAFT_1503991 [Pisolithus thermaeus]